MTSHERINNPNGAPSAVEQASALSAALVALGELTDEAESNGNSQVWLAPRYNAIKAALNSPTANAADLSCDYKCMFEDAAVALAKIDTALGIDPDECGGAEPILQAISALHAERDQWVDANYVEAGRIAHADDAAVDRFAVAMKVKMASSRAKGRGGWDDPAQCTVEKLASMLCQHVEKGDPVDIANFAMMIHQRGGCAIDVYEALAVFMSARTINNRPAAAMTVAQVDNRRCKKCASIRGGDTCWKCGSETFTPDPRCGEEPRLPPIDRIRELAKEVGYAIGVHGSQQRDFDVIAAPWTDVAIGNHALLQHIAAGLTTDNGPAHIISTERKPLGRYAATIQMDGWYKQLDISVCPSEQYAPITVDRTATNGEKDSQ